MTLRKIAQVGHPILRQRSAELTKEQLLSSDIQNLIDDMIDTMRDANGAGIAAPQVYVPVRIIVMEVGNNPRYPYKPKIPLTILVNPVLTPLVTETFDNYEGCLSVPNLRGKVARCAHVRVQAWDRNANPHEYEIKGVTAGTYQHECDHLDGKLFIDRVTDPSTFSTWDAFDRFHKDAFVEQITAVAEKWGQ